MKRFYTVIVLAAIFYRPASSQEEMILRDPWAFETAGEMYSVNDTLPFDNKASEIMKEISVNLKKEICLEDEKIWKLLMSLEPYRKSKQVQDSIKQWCKFYYYSPVCTTSDVSRLARQYRNKDFKTVITDARKMLGRPSSDIPQANQSTKEMYPEFGVRNNLALALIHENQDLCAQVELEIILFNRSSFSSSSSSPSASNVRFDVQAFNNTYLSAMMNLTVVYERLGRPNDAERLAGSLHDYAMRNELNSSPVAFNAAWYHFKLTKKGNYLFDKNRKKGNLK
ncbi:MAG: hypothetical protein LBC40_02090 [Dysgonamonadaceae bacterium]|jgi:hypothetical protein|nr:hypothetical protein [Dysgonamonadaceae bacterium]